jgi:hypothetical protein
MQKFPLRNTLSLCRALGSTEKSSGSCPTASVGVSSNFSARL